MKNWKDFRLSTGLEYEPMSDKTYEFMENEMEQYAELRLGAVSGSISSMKETMDSFFQEIEEEIKAEPNNMELIGARWAYRIAMEQFNNRFKKYYR